MPAALALIVVATQRAHAQSVSGVVRGADERPVSGAVVELLDSSSTAVARALTSSLGAFALRTTVGGRYTVRARQVGRRPVSSPPLQLRTNSSESISLTFDAATLALDTVRVASRTVCGRADDSTSSVVAALEYARTALMASDAVRGRGFTATSMRYERTLDPIRERITSQEIRTQRDPAAQPWLSFPIDSLRRNGYVVAGRGDSTIYRLPGLDMLASAAFVDDHCFQFNGKSDKKRIGVSFEPSSARRKVIDMRGTLWLDRATAGLQSLEFRYTGLSGAQDDAKPGGAMQFDRLRDGTWTVTEWSVRMPLLARRLPVPGARVGSGVPEIIVDAIRVSGGQISSIISATAGRTSDTLWARPGVLVSGVVRDSASGRALPNARVGAMGTAVQTTSDEEGKFSLNGLLPGDYTVQVRTASLDSVRTMATFPVTVSDAGPPTSFNFKVANATTIVALLCPVSDTKTAATRGLMVGQILGDSLTLREGARVVIEWPTAAEATGVGATTWVSLRADEQGGFRMCGLPTDKTFTVRASTTGASSASVDVPISAASRFAAAELTLDRNRAASAVFTGVVVSDSMSRVVGEAEVSIPSLNRTARTNSDGRFRISDIPPGEHRIIVRKLGLTPVDVSLSFGVHEIVDRRVVLGKVSILDSVIVIADRPDPAMREFEENRKIGIGRFITREELERQKAARLTALLTTMNGIRFARLYNRLYATAGRRAATGGSDRCYFFDGQDSIVNCQSTPECFMQVWIDNHPLFRGQNSETVPDLSHYSPQEFEAIEIYSSGAETPSRYMGTGTQCGVIILHRRR